MPLAINRFFALAVACGVLWGCAQTTRPAATATPSGDHTIYVLSTDWHTGIVVARADLEAVGGVPERAAFPDARYLEFGWGDRDYYPAPRPTVGMALAAAFASSASVMHLAGYDEQPDQRYPAAEVLAVATSAPALARLVRSIDASFERGGADRAEVVAPGLYRDSHFYPARGRFSLANTCNTWTAQRLADAGLGISPEGVTTASDLMGRVRAVPGVSRLAP